MATNILDQSGNPGILDEFDPDDIVDLFSIFSDHFAARQIINGNARRMLTFVREIRSLENNTNGL